MKDETRPKNAVLAACVPTMLLAATSVAADQVVLTPTRDNTLFSNDPHLSNGAGPMLFFGAIASGGTRRALLRFDLTGIPPGSVIHSASLRFFINRVPVSSGSADVTTLHRLTADWGEGSSSTTRGQGAQATAQDATWSWRFYGQPPTTPRTSWSVSGGDFVSTPTATIEVGGIGPYEFSSSSRMLTDLQSWVDQPQTNFGWMIRGAEDHEQTARRIDSRESATAANRPTLTITYDMATTDVPVPPWSLLLLGGTLAAMIARKARA